MEATISRIGTTVGNSNLIYNVFQNAGKSYQSGLEVTLSQKINKWASLQLNMNGYQNIIDAFTVLNKYPEPTVYTAPRVEMFSGNVKLNSTFQLPSKVELQLTAIYLAPDIVPQGKIYSRFSIDMGAKKTIGRNEFFVNATDIANTLRIKRDVTGNGFTYTSTDYLETQVFRIGYAYKF